MLQFDLSRKMTRIVGLWMVLMLSAFALIAQTNNGNVGIGTDKPDKSALLDLTSNSKGLLVPRMTLTQRGSIETPANGLLVYQTDFFSGFYFFDGATQKWRMLYSRTPDGLDIGTGGGTTSNELAWNITGNSGLSPDNFIGTKDTVSLVFRVNNFRSGLIDYKTLNTYLGYRAGFRAKGVNSVALGAYALQDANIGLNNIAVGYASLLANQTGNDNIGIGATALSTNNSGSRNIAIGSQAGSKSIGNGNIFIGYRAGFNEIGNNKLYIDNQGTGAPLLYGDFETFRLGINTNTPNSTLSIDSKVANVSGLEFKQLNSNSPTAKSSSKVLSVDETGKVILVESVGGTGGGGNPTNYWTISGVGISNTNTGVVGIKNGLIVDNGLITNQKLEVNSGVANKSGFMLSQLKSTSPTVASNTKVLSVDENGNVILVPDLTGQNLGQQFWVISDNEITNVNTGRIRVQNGLSLNLNSGSPTVASNSKVLSVDDKGNVILVPDQVGQAGAASDWSLNGTEISNKNAGKVSILNGLKLNLKATSPTTPSNSRVLTVDNEGNVVLSPDQIGSAVSSQWAESGNDISNINNGKVRINNLTLGLKGTSPMSASNSKVLTVDNDGNVILAPDQVGVSIPSQWTLTGNQITNANGGIVNIVNGLKLNLKATSQPSVSNSKVLSVDNEGNVFLAPDQVGVSAPIQWNIIGNEISNANAGKVSITAGLKLNLKATSPTIASNSRVLTVDNDGNVALAPDQIGSAVSSQWAESGNDISNINNGKVRIANLTLGLKGTSQTSPSNAKVLTVDNDGNVILAPDQVGNSAPTQWNITGTEITNANAGKVNISAGLKLNIKATSPTTASNSKVLSVDNDGNVVLVPDQIGQTTTSQWSVSGEDITNANNGKVLINNDLAFAKIKSTNTTVASNSKVLSVDENGKVILVPDQIGQAVAQQWTAAGNDISNANTGRVILKNGLNFTGLNSNTATTIKSDKVLSVDGAGNVILVNNASEAGSTQNLPWKVDGQAMSNTNTGGVAFSGGAANKSGVKFINLNAASPAATGFGKVLSIDDAGNVILVNDLLGNVPPQMWYESDGRAQRDSKVAIGGGIPSFPNGYNLYVKGGILTERVRVAVAGSDRWADYVFGKDYKLMSLKNVEKFIKKYHHLPNVPSAEEMAKNGLDVTETSAKLMEKIEELTLYLIEANKRIEKLETKINALK